ncbi:MAG: hypothetical protein Q9174_002554 [Haloplaca sp. 1 TL-2023]
MTHLYLSVPRRHGNDDDYEFDGSTYVNWDYQSANLKQQNSVQQTQKNSSDVNITSPNITSAIDALSKWAVPRKLGLGFPFDRPEDRSLLANPFRCLNLLENIIRFSERSSIAYFEVGDGLYDGLDFDNEEISKPVLERLDTVESTLRVFLVPQNRKTRRREWIISRSAFESIFLALQIPTRFIEVTAANNGVYQSHTTYDEGGKPKDFHLLIKLPASFINASIYFRYNLSKESCVCFILSNGAPVFQPALQQTFKEDQRTDADNHQPAKSPLRLIECLVSEIVGPMEPERQKLDVRVRDLEAKTGMSAHVFDESHKASADEHSTLLKDLHVCEGLLAFFERTVQFQVGWIEWLQTQQAVLNQHRFGVSEVPKLPSSWRAAEEGIASSLASSGSFSRETLEQVKTLRNRIRIQLSVVANFIAQNDSRTNIAVAEASRRIAFETKRDSDAMKTIAALTMVFLPATFVATLFGMVFFTTDGSSPAGFRVNSYWWMYLAATIPLTLLTVGTWLGWLRWVRWKRRQDEESLGLKEKSM